jgi:hypothetical protein
LIKTITKKRAGVVAQGVGPELKPQYHKRIIKKKSLNFLYESQAPV